MFKIGLGLGSSSPNPNPTQPSLRSGLVVTCLLNGRFSNEGRADETIPTTLVEYVHWKNTESLKPYDRWITTYFSSIGALQEDSEKRESFNTIRQLAINMGFLEEENGSTDQVEPNGSIEDPEELSPLLYHDYNGSNVVRWTPNVRRLQVPQHFKDYHRQLNEDLDEKMKREKGSKDKAWLAYWKRTCTAEAKKDKKCQELLNKDQQYQAELDRDRRLAIERAYGANSIIQKWYSDRTAQQFVASKKQQKFDERDKQNTVNILTKSGYKRKLTVMNKREEEEIEQVRSKYRRLRRQLGKEYESILNESDSNDDSEQEELVEIVLTDDESE